MTHIREGFLHLVLSPLGAQLCTAAAAVGCYCQRQPTDGDVVLLLPRTSPTLKISRRVKRHEMIECTDKGALTSKSNVFFMQLRLDYITKISPVCLFLPRQDGSSVCLCVLERFMQGVIICQALKSKCLLFHSPTLPVSVCL